VPDYSFKPGDRVGPWIVETPLGIGGNGEVWEARRDDGLRVALKILRSRNPESEPYARFRAEVRVMTTVKDDPGVLPLLDYSLPERPIRGNPAWLATPVATLIRDALAQQDATLHDTIDAMATIAETLDRLATTHGISHRDVKPSNLFWWDNRWVVGDFGLADYPDKEALTPAGRKLGPLHFMAPEMLSDALAANGTSADVYSLAKTLWVLATGQTYPPPGEQRVDVPGLTTSVFVNDARAPLLDRLIERATQHTASDRPTMADLARELRAWLAHPHETASIGDLSELGARIAAAIEPSRRAQATREAHARLGQRVGDELAAALKQIVDSLAGVAPFDTGVDEARLPAGFEYPGALGEPEVVWRCEACIQTKEIGAYSPLITLGTIVEVFDEGAIRVVAAYLVGDPGNNDLVWGDEFKVPIGSAEQEQQLAALVAGMRENARTALQHYAALVGA
jgi:hypothetical protein